MCAIANVTVAIALPAIVGSLWRSSRAKNSFTRRTPHEEIPTGSIIQAGCLFLPRGAFDQKAQRTNVKRANCQNSKTRLLTEGNRTKP